MLTGGWAAVSSRWKSTAVLVHEHSSSYLGVAVSFRRHGVCHCRALHCACGLCLVSSTCSGGRCTPAGSRDCCLRDPKQGIECIEGPRLLCVTPLVEHLQEMILARLRPGVWVCVSLCDNTKVTHLAAIMLRSVHVPAHGGKACQGDRPHTPRLTYSRMSRNRQSARCPWRDARQAEIPKKK